MAPSYDSNTRASELVPLYAPHITNKIILVTGVSPGSLGESFVKQVAAGKPATFILAGRNPAKFQPLIDELTANHPDINVKPLALDLTSFAQVRNAASSVNSWADVPRIDLLVNNAGIMAVPYKLTEDGNESQFQTNHLSHFLFTNLLMPKILASADPRIINVSSGGHRLGHMRWTDYNFDNGKNYEKWRAYGQSKTANSLFSIALAERLGRKVSAFSLCPGFVSTNLSAHEAHDYPAFLESLRKVDVVMGTKFLWGFGDIQPKDLDQGVATHVYAAFDQALKEKNGEYVTDCHVADPYQEEVYPWARSTVDADMLWRLSEKLVGQEFRY
ncbi:short-chain dehydrogenase [Colletotrichum truncatum]|uniref:Short-chain dehydrogenase n=1 Tax=Colletotrichum truncatum TaxID=5467 RepID=A0ACC3Z348_COLTU|nr:short-chain dehydrogenase [Colletotrichum truncatum]KAF6793195.1 short-chain dehydrogenase [Colletotrichum truncatum]